MKKFIIFFLLSIFLVSSAAYGSGRIVLVDGDGNEISSSNPLSVEGV